MGTLPRIAALAIALAALPGAARAAGDAPIAEGSYCPLPRAGEVPECLDPARAEYGELFAGLEEGRLDPEDAARMEAEVAAGLRSERPYDALSTLAYAYWRLSREAAASPGADPELAARLAAWNQLLARSYAASEEGSAYRESVRTAALDLRERAPAVAIRCTDEEGETVPCESTAELVRALRDARDRAGVSGALGRLLRRFLPGDEE